MDLDIITTILVGMLYILLFMLLYCVYDLARGVYAHTQIHNTQVQQQEVSV